MLSPKKMWKFPTIPTKKPWVSSWGVENMGGMGHINHIIIPWVQFLMGWSSPCPVFAPISGFESPRQKKNAGLKSPCKKKKKHGFRVAAAHSWRFIPLMFLLFGNSAFLISYECAFPASNHGLIDGWPILIKHPTPPLTDVYQAARYFIKG